MIFKAKPKPKNNDVRKKLKFAWWPRRIDEERLWVFLGFYYKLQKCDLDWRDRPTWNTVTLGTRSRFKNVLAYEWEKQRIPF